MQKVRITAVRDILKNGRKRRKREFVALGEGRTKKLALADAKRNLSKYVKKNARMAFGGKAKKKAKR